MIGRLTARSLVLHPVRTAVLAGGFGLGVAVMANLLGVAAVVLEQSQSPSLAGGGDVVLTGAAGPLTSARYLLWGALGAPAFADRIAVAAPTRRDTLYLVQDTPADEAWTSPDPDEVLRGLDRFHPIPDVPARAGSWTEWLYFNGQSGSTRFYLTFLVGPRLENGRRVAGVRLQLDRGGEVTTYGDAAEVDPDEVLATAPELTIGANRVRVEDGRYLLAFDLPGARGPGRSRGPRGPRATGEIALSGRRGQALPPISIAGAGGWVSGYVVPVMSGTLDGVIRVQDEALPLTGGAGYHDHNWGFWEGVSWQWGQVQHDGLSILYGRVFPPADAADASRMPGFLMVLGPDGPLGQATRVTIDETNDAGGGRPARIVVTGTSPSLDLTLDIAVESGVTTPMTGGPRANRLDFFQLRGRYTVSGTAGERTLQFTAPGAAETFRGR